MNTPTSKVEALRDKIAETWASIDGNVGIAAADEILQAFATFLEGVMTSLPASRNMADMRGLGQIGNEGYNERVLEDLAALHQVVTALRGGE